MFFYRSLSCGFPCLGLVRQITSSHHEEEQQGVMVFLFHLEPFYKRKKQDTHQSEASVWVINRIIWAFDWFFARVLYPVQTRKK